MSEEMRDRENRIVEIDPKLRFKSINVSDFSSDRLVESVDSSSSSTTRQTKQTLDQLVEISSEEEIDWHSDDSSVDSRALSPINRLDDRTLGLEYTRESVKDRPMSPILLDPQQLDKPAEDVLSDEEVERLKNMNLYVVRVPLNEGKFATIFEARHQCGADIVIKRSYALRQSYAELEALELFGSKKKHKNIIRLFGHRVIECRIYLFIEFSRFGDLSQYLSREYRDKDLTESQVYELFRQVYDGVEHMHHNGYAHRDLKCQNILVFNYRRKDGLRLKLCDFGSARGDLRRSDGTIRLSTTVIGSPQTMAPEVVTIAYNPFKSDTYSLGVILYQLSHSSAFPFDLIPKNTKLFLKLTDLSLRKLIPKSIRFSPFISEELKQLLQRILEPSPEIRITIEDIVSTEWFQKQQALKK